MCFSKTARSNNLCLERPFENSLKPYTFMFLSLAASLVDAPTAWFVGVEHDEMVPGTDVFAGLGSLVSIDNAANPSRDSAPR